MCEEKEKKDRNSFNHNMDALRYAGKLDLSKLPEHLLRGKSIRIGESNPDLYATEDKVEPFRSNKNKSSKTDPKHYKHGGLETWDIIQAVLTPEEWRGYLKGNIMKYRDRAEHKGDAETDYEKAKRYYEKLTERQRDE